MTIVETLRQEFSMTENHVNNIIGLIDEGCTIPFIARYRKEMTGSASDETLRAFADRLNYLRNLHQRKEEVFRLISEQEKMTPEIEQALNEAKTMTEVEDIYRPFKPKRKTRASVAIAKGLQPLADYIFNQKAEKDLMEYAKEFINDEVKDEQEAIAGAKDIIAEMISDNAEMRKQLRKLFGKYAKIASKLADSDTAIKYEVYKDFSEKVDVIPSHRILALNRGEKDGGLKVDIVMDGNTSINFLKDMFIHKNGDYADIMEQVIVDSYERLI